MTSNLDFKLVNRFFEVVNKAEMRVSSSEKIWRNVALHHLLSNGSSAVNGCRQNESPNS